MSLARRSNESTGCKSVSLARTVAQHAPQEWFVVQRTGSCKNFRCEGVGSSGREKRVVMNVVVLAGRVADRPFRPGNGDRVVVKVDVEGENPSKSDRIELHCFGAVADRAMRLWQGDLIGVRGRIELRIWTEDGEEYDELRVVAHRVDVMVKGNNERPNRDGGSWGNRERSDRADRGGSRPFNRDTRGPREQRGGGEWLRPDERLEDLSTPGAGRNDDDHWRRFA